MLKIDVISVQPKMFAGFLTESIVARAVAKGACEVIDQVNMTRRRGFAGNALFDLDTTLEKRILSFLRLGLW